MHDLHLRILRRLVAGKTTLTSVAMQTQALRLYRLGMLRFAGAGEIHGAGPWAITDYGRERHDDELHERARRAAEAQAALGEARLAIEKARG